MSVEIVVISLSRAVARRKAMDAMFDGSGLTWSYFDAHESLKHRKLSYDPEIAKKRFGRTLSLPEIAVCSSHAAVVSDFLEHSAHDYVLVLEDDVIYDVDFPLDKFSALCAENSIDYIRLFGKHYAQAAKIGFFFDRSIIRFKSSPAGSQAYIMSKAGARLFTNSYQTVDATIDFALDSFWHTQMPIYSIFPYPIIERYTPSSIPMQAYAGELSPRQKLTWNLNRTMAKARKLLANNSLRAVDRRMQKSASPFRQILGND